MNREHASLIKRIDASGKEVLAYVEALSQDQLHNAPAPNEWSVHAVVAHLRDVEQHVFLKRIGRILSEEQPQVANFDQEQWNREHYSAMEPLDKIIAELRAARAEELEILRKTSDEDWARWAVIPSTARSRSSGWRCTITVIRSNTCTKC